MRKRQPIAKRFWVKVEKSIGCWLWRGARDKDGYGQFKITSRSGTARQEKAHRVAWVLTYGPIRDDDLVLHHCDNPPCVKPMHLFIGDVTANRRDAAAKGRIHPHPNFHKRGQEHSHAKLTDEDVIEIRRLYKEEPIFQRQIGAIYGIHQSAVSAIIKRKTWRHLLP